MEASYIRPKYTPENIDRLQPGEIFVFGSNLEGMHGGGAARTAFNKFGAVWGKGVGLQGQSYAIPTMHGGVEAIRPYVDEFIAFAKEHSEYTFLVTRIGCGIAGFRDEEIALLFIKAVSVSNIVLPETFIRAIKVFRPLGEETRMALLEKSRDDNPYPIGTLGHGIWEQKLYFDLLWNSYDQCDWHEFFEKFNLHEDFERGVLVTDDLMHDPINKEFVFNLYWSALFSAERVCLLEQCHYYKGEVIPPFENGKGLWWDYERCWVDFNLEKSTFLAQDLDWYKREGLSNLCPYDGVPMSMKTLLMNRYFHWGCGHETMDSFREWYIGLDYTNITKIHSACDLNDKENREFIFFWGHHGKPDKVTKACLSQWYPANFTVDGIHYNCAEQYMMAEKARIMGDEETRKRILLISDPQIIKALGREVKNYEEHKWYNHKYQVVVKGNLHKFLDNDNLRDFLLSTGDTILVEASPYDTVWGIGMKEDDPRAKHPRQWKGENLLGFALMDVRAKLKKLLQ